MYQIGVHIGANWRIRFVRRQRCRLSLRLLQQLINSLILLHSVRLICEASRQSNHIYYKLTIPYTPYSRKLRYGIYGCSLSTAGIAVDWLADNLYWTDYSVSQVWMSRVDGLFQKVIARNLSGPCNIVIDHVRKYDCLGLTVYNKRALLYEMCGCELKQWTNTVITRSYSYPVDVNHLLLAQLLPRSRANAITHMSTHTRCFCHIDNFLSEARQQPLPDPSKVTLGKLRDCWSSTYIGRMPSLHGTVDRLRIIYCGVRSLTLNTVAYVQLTYFLTY